MSRHPVWTIVRMTLTLAIFAFLLRDVDGRAALDALRRFAPSALGLFLLLIAADRLLMLARWILLMRMTTDVPASELARIFFVSSFVGSFLPAGVGGDAARAISVTRHTGEPGPAVASVVIDRLLGLQAVAIAGCIGIVWGGHLVPPVLRTLTLIVSVVLIVASGAGFYADGLAATLLPAWLRRTRLGRGLVALGESMAAYRRHAGILWRVSLLSFVVQGVRVLIAWSIGIGLAIPLRMAHYWVFMPLIILVTLLPLSVGGFGVPQGAMVWALTPLGVTSTDAFLLSMLFTIAGTISNLPGAWLYVRGRRARSAADLPDRQQIL